MNYALVINGQVVRELLIGEPFTDENGISHGGNVITLWSTEELAEIGVLPIIEFEPPAGASASAGTVEMIDGVPTRVPLKESASEPT